jgi:transposase
MPTPPEPPAAAEADDSAPREKRWSARRKTEIVYRLLRGESLDALSRETSLPVSRIAEWRDEFVAAGEAALKSRPPEASGMSEADRRDMQAKVGELTMENELLRAKNAKLEANLPPALRRSKR